jgi:hypothetical protein
LGEEAILYCAVGNLKTISGQLASNGYEVKELSVSYYRPFQSVSVTTEDDAQCSLGRFARCHQSLQVELSDGCVRRIILRVGKVYEEMNRFCFFFGRSD